MFIAPFQSHLSFTNVFPNSRANKATALKTILTKLILQHPPALARDLPHLIYSVSPPVGCLVDVGTGPQLCATAPQEHHQ